MGKRIDTCEMLGCNDVCMHALFIYALLCHGSLAMSCDGISHDAATDHVTSGTPCYARSYSCYVMLCFALLCDVLCYLARCCVVPYIL